MSEQMEHEEATIRIRLSVQRKLYERIDRLADTLGIDRNQAAVFGLSMGLHALGLGVNPPLGKVAEVMHQYGEEAITQALKSETPHPR